MKVQQAILLHPDGKEEVVNPQDGKKFSLQELQDFVGGWIELVLVRPGNGRCQMYANEEGKLKGMFPNRKATAMSVAGDLGDVVVGTVVVVRKVEKQ